MARPSNALSLILPQTLQMAVLDALPPRYSILLRMIFPVFQKKPRLYILLTLLFAVHTSIACWRHIRNLYFVTLEVRYNNKLYNAILDYAVKNSTGVSHNDKNNSDIDSGDEKEDFDTYWKHWIHLKFKKCGSQDTPWFLDLRTIILTAWKIEHLKEFVHDANQHYIECHIHCVAVYLDHVLADIKTYLKGRSCPPGTGKSSLAFVIASELQLDIYTLSLNSSGLDEEQLVALFHAIPKHCIVLLEDVNCSGISREHSDSAANAEMKDKTSGGLTLSSLLNALDGPATPEGYILIVTINYREKLDKALIRPGWVDMEVPFSYADKDMIRDLFSCLCMIPPIRYRPRSATTEFQTLPWNLRVKFLGASSPLRRFKATFCDTWGVLRMLLRVPKNGHETSSARNKLDRALEILDVLM
ncbi:BCS1-like ATPase [Coccidioides posadasii str. Silveira]|uniref:BCS1-like ATPase n=1 Tax=Coccidioides posadasii (strain RMSCC 757 / Silveira) TaxID=443226 RepID=E9DDJ6_COCPS|nr:BCS1-like ATPase [Coccidioides posadasii str. Silveira]